MNNTLKNLCLVGILGATISGCTLFAVGGAAAFGGLAAADRRTIGTQTDDQIMETVVSNQVRDYLRKVGATNTDISVVSYNGNILLLGEVNDESQRAVAERTARAQRSAKRVYNYITVSSQSNSSVKDTWTTSKIRTVLLKPQGVAPNHIKVVTYNGVAYAMGILTEAEQNVATQAISTTSGVQRVITLYETFTPPPTLTR